MDVAYALQMDQAVRHDEQLVATVLAQPRTRDDPPISEAFEAIRTEGAVAMLRAHLDWAPEVEEDDVVVEGPDEVEGQVISMKSWVDHMNRELRGG